MPQQERVERFSPEIKTAFRDWVKNRGIKVALFDIDGTLVDADALFVGQFEKFYLYCRELIPNFDIDKFRTEFTETNDELFATMGVSTKKWAHIVDLLSKKHHVDLSGGLTFFDELYTTAPEIFDGVVETLELCKEVGLKVGLVTHATYPWTEKKREKLGVDVDHINVVDVDKYKYKGPEHWKESVDFFEVDPSEVMVVGDNLRGDIESSYQIGVRTLAWIPSGWHVYNRGNIPEEEYIKVDKIGNLIETLCQKK